MHTLAVSGTRLLVAATLLVVLFALVLGSTIVIGLRALPVGANHNNDGAVHVCVNNATGAMREVSNPNRCRGYEHPIELGGLIVPGLEIVNATKPLPPGYADLQVASCPPGKKVLGGGVKTLPSASDIAVISTHPFTNTSWMGEMANRTNFDLTMIVYAICADAPCNDGMNPASTV